MPICFTVVDTAKINSAAGDDSSIPVVGEIHFVAQLPEGQQALSPSDAEYGTSYWIDTFVGYFDTDGVLKDAPGGTPGVKIWANVPALNLEGELPYLVYAPKPLSGNGKHVNFEPFVFNAPYTEITLKLSEIRLTACTTTKGAPR